MPLIHRRPDSPKHNILNILRSVDEFLASVGSSYTPHSYSRRLVGPPTCCNQYACGFSSYSTAAAGEVCIIVQVPAQERYNSHSDVPDEGYGRRTQTPITTIRTPAYV